MSCVLSSRASFRSSGRRSKLCGNLGSLLSRKVRGIESRGTRHLERREIIAISTELCLKASETMRAHLSHQEEVEDLSGRETRTSCESLLQTYRRSISSCIADERKRPFLRLLEPRLRQLLFDSLTMIDRIRYRYRSIESKSRASMRPSRLESESLLCSTRCGTISKSRSFLQSC